VGGLMLVEAAVRKVGELLNEPHVRPSEPRPFRPGEICVLVRTNATGGCPRRRKERALHRGR